MTEPVVDEASFNEMLDVLRKFVQSELIPQEEELESSGVIPEYLYSKIAELGIYGASIAPEYGGLGLNYSQEARMHMVLSEAAQGFRYIYGTNVGIGSRAISLDGTESQKQRWLPGIASGQIQTAFCATEPQAGSDLANLTTKAVRDGDHFIITGSKRFISNAHRADLLTVLARTGDADSGAAGVSAFLVEAKTAGISLGAPEKKLGHRGGIVSDVYFDNVRVPAANIIGGKEGRGFTTAMRTLDAGRLTVASNSIGQMRRAIDEASGYALQRQQFGQPIAHFQLVQGLLADSETEWYASCTMVQETARLLDLNGRASREAACTKYFVSEALGRVADRCLQVLGGSGYIADYPLERILRDARVSRIYEGTSQIMQLIIAKDLLRRRSEALGL
jgi:acyl-CoA dehydrogenase